MLMMAFGMVAFILMILCVECIRLEFKLDDLEGLLDEKNDNQL